MPGRRWEAALQLYLFGGNVSPGAFPVLAAGAKEGVGRGMPLTLIAWPCPPSQGCSCRPPVLHWHAPWEQHPPGEGAGGGGTSLRKGIKLLEGTYLPVGPSPRAAGEDSVAMRRELNFIITLYYLMSVSQAAGDVLMKLELHSL